MTVPVLSEYNSKCATTTMVGQQHYPQSPVQCGSWQHSDRSNMCSHKYDNATNNVADVMIMGKCGKSYEVSI